MSEPLGVALVGCGTVGTGVAKILSRHADRLTSRTGGRAIVLRHVIVRDADKPRECELPAGLIAIDHTVATSDPAVHVVVELIGGTTHAKRVVLDAIAAGKHVVTANKALLAAHGTEIFTAARKYGVAVCFDLNFDHVAVELERQKAQLVFWPSMYWGGALLQHWALRYGFVMAAAYGLESCIVDMNGRYLAKQGNETFQVRAGHLPPWVIAEININRELFHLDDNQKHFVAMREKYGPDIEIEVEEPEGYFLLSSRRPDLTVETIAAEFHLETLRDYLARSVKLRNERLRP